MPHTVEIIHPWKPVTREDLVINVYTREEVEDLLQPLRDEVAKLSGVVYRLASDYYQGEKMEG
jgi:hypothetical protein